MQHLDAALAGIAQYLDVTLHAEVASIQIGIFVPFGRRTASHTLVRVSRAGPRELREGRRLGQ